MQESPVFLKVYVNFFFDPEFCFFLKRCSRTFRLYIIFWFFKTKFPGPPAFVSLIVDGHSGIKNWICWKYLIWKIFGSKFSTHISKWFFKNSRAIFRTLWRKCWFSVIYHIYASYSCLVIRVILGSFCLRKFTKNYVSYGITNKE